MFNILLLLSPFVWMSNILEVPEYTDIELRGVFEDYEQMLKSNIYNMSSLKNIRDTLVEDVKVEISGSDKEYNIAVLDVGGSFFKIAIVNLKTINGKLDCKITSTTNFSYPIVPKDETVYWYDWVADQYINHMISENIKPDFSSLIFSYAITYKEGGIASPIDLSKHWCFEREEAIGSDLKRDLNRALQKKLKAKLDTSYTRYLVNSVLNDSVATFFSSKILLDDKAIGIILGTGTNGAFIIENEGIDFVYNTEWGSFIPKSLVYSNEERSYIDSLTVNYNLLDILIGNGYKIALLNEIIRTRNINIQKYKGDNVGDIMKKDDTDKHKLIMTSLIRRSRQLMSMMVCASIKQLNTKKITILLNGSGYSELSERNEFLDLIKNYAKDICGLDVDINMYYEEGLTFIGAAYYSFAKHIAN